MDLLSITKKYLMKLTGSLDVAFKRNGKALVDYNDY
jgi:hypothetical protein